MHPGLGGGDTCPGQVISAFALVRISPAEAARALDTARSVLATHAARDGV